jgi:hypothetical protein
MDEPHILCIDAHMFRDKLLSLPQRIDILQFVLRMYCVLPSVVLSAVTFSSRLVF